jgi:hypothetical protein
MRIGRIAAAGLFFALLTTVLPVGTQMASAAVTLVACPAGTEATDFQPGLTLVPRPTTVHVEGTLGSCVSTSNPAINNATFTINGSGTASCLTASFNSTMVVDWNSGANSVIRYNLTVNIKPAGETVFVSEGEVVSGQFAGAQVVRTTIEATLDALKCLTVQGVMTASGPTALVIAG